MPLIRRRKVLCADIVRILKCFIARHFHSAPIFNAGVVFREAKEEKADPVENGIRLFLFLFRLSNIPPSKIALLDERTLGKATALRAAPAAAERGEVLRLTLARFLISRRKTRGKPQRSVSGLPLTRRRKVLCADIVRTLKCFIARHFHSAPIFNGGVSPQTSERGKGSFRCKRKPPYPLSLSFIQQIANCKARYKTLSFPATACACPVR